MTVIAMSRTEIDRMSVLQDLATGRIKVAEAATLMGLGGRQVYRLAKGYHHRGPAALVSRRRGRPSNRSYPFPAASAVRRRNNAVGLTCRVHARRGQCITFLPKQLVTAFVAKIGQYNEVHKWAQKVGFCVMCLTLDAGLTPTPGSTKRTQRAQIQQ